MNLHMDDITRDIREPSTLKQALKSPQRAFWIKAMKEEEDSLRSHRTWSEDIYSIPDGRKSVGTKWIFKLKHDEFGKIVRYKARLVAKGFSQIEGQDYTKGFSQIEGQDYTDTFAPVMQSTTLRSLLSLAASENYELHQIDVKTAFLYGDLDEDIYIKLPDGTIRKLQKAMYGLKQASRQFYKRFNASLIKFGLTRCATDPCCYFRNINGQKNVCHYSRGRRHYYW